MEKTDKMMKKMLANSNPFKEEKCNKNNCEICLFGDNINYKARDVLYRMSCQGVNKDGNQ